MLPAAALPALLRRLVWVIICVGVVAAMRPELAFAADPILTIGDGGAVIGPGDTATYTITVTNDSPTGLLQAMELDVVLSDGVTVAACTINPPLSGACLIAPDGKSGQITISEELGVAGATGLISGTVTVAAQTRVSQATDVTAWVAFRAEDGVGLPVDAGPVQARTTVLQPAVTTTLSAGAPTALPGDLLRYAVRMANHGPVTAHAVSAVLTLPSAATPLAASDGGTQPDAVTVRWDAMTLPAAGGITRTVDVALANPLVPVVAQLTATLTATHASAAAAAIPPVSAVTPVVSGTASGRVWRDRDGNGVRNNGEAGLGDIEIIIESATIRWTATTWNDGRYEAPGLRPGNYTVSLDLTSLPPGLAPTFERDLVLDNRDAVTVSATAPVAADFGFARPSAAAGGALFLDRNGNGVREAGDDGIPGVVVLAYSPGADKQFNTADDLLVTAETDVLGRYGFSDLLPGRYRIRVEQSSLPGGYLLNSDPDGDLNGFTAVTLVEESVMDGIDFGYAALDLRIEQSDGDLTKTTGAPLPYQLRVENVGPVAATDVAVVEMVPADTRADLALSTGGWQCDGDGSAGDRCLFPVGPLAAGESRDLVFTVSVADAMPAHTNVVTNTVQVVDRAVGAPDPTPQNNRSIVETPVDAIPDLAISQTDGGTRTEPGLPLIYTMTYRNRGNQHASGVAVSQTVPEHTTFDPDRSTPGWICAPDNEAGSRCLFAVGDLAAGEEGELAFAMLLEPSMPVNVAAINAEVSIYDDRGVNASDSELTPVDSTPDLQLVKIHDADGVEPGTVIVFRLEYSNAGNQDAIGVLVVETVPAYTSFEAGQSTSGWNCQRNGQAGDRCIFSIGALAAGASGRLDFAVRVEPNLPPNIAEIGSTAVIAGSGLELDIVNNEASGSVTVARPTAVDLVDFAADARASVIELAWETSAERDSWGFILYRSTDHSWENAIRITPRLIEAEGSETAGAVYRFTDESVVPGVSYLYWLQELELTGRTTIYGPIAGALNGVRPEEPTPGPGPGVDEPGIPRRTNVYLPLVLNQ